MTEITRENFVKRLPAIKESLRNAKFVSIDLEFSALYPLKSHCPSLFDTNKERYTKLRRNLEHVVPLQVGLTAFQFNRDKDSYFGEVFTFYVSPPAFGDLDKVFYCQASTVAFLTLHGFDLNKFARSGVPYLNTAEEKSVRQQLKWNSVMGNLESDTELSRILPLVDEWFRGAKVGDHLSLPQLDKYKFFDEINYLMHRHFRSHYNAVWTYVDSVGVFNLKKVDVSELKGLNTQYSLDNIVLDSLIGFSHVFKFLASLRKPLVGHNLLQDLMIVTNCFDCPLPPSYSQFKAQIISRFPTIFDTKTLYYELRHTISKDKCARDTSLECLFNYFQGGLGSNLVKSDRTVIDSDIDNKHVGKYHQAGWDSYCAGYIFIRMAHYNANLNFPGKDTFVSAELMGGLEEWRNRVNVIRGSTTHIRLDGEDPSSNRPPWLVVSARKKRQLLDLTCLVSLLGCYGSVDIQKIPGCRHKVLVAVDNFVTAREISKKFRRDPTFQVEEYNFLRHSNAVGVIFIGALAISGTILMWMMCRK